VVDQSGKTSVQLHRGWTAGDAVGPGVQHGPRLSRAFLRAVQVAIGADFVIALRSRNGGAATRPEVTQDFFGDNSDYLFDFALIQSSGLIDIALKTGQVSLLRMAFLDVSNLVHAALVAASRKRSRKPNRQDFARLFLRNELGP